MSRFNLRPADAEDAFQLMRLYQLSSVRTGQDPLFLNYGGLVECIRSSSEIWMVVEDRGDMVAMSSSLVDSEQRLCKIQRIYCDPLIGGMAEIQKDLIDSLIEKASADVDVIYCTSKLLTFSQVELTESIGFRVLGIFPISTLTEEISGLTAYFYPGVLEAMRYTDFPLHPMIEPFYEILRKKWDLPPLAVKEDVTLPEFAGGGIPELEMITAHRFVSRRFQRLRERKMLSSNFYPFQEPNTLICDPDEKVEIFAGVYPERRFAAIIEERFETALNPSELYNKVALMIKGEHISYIEVIIDAADVIAIELMLTAGFLPCAYFPCLKKHADKRRDFVILGRSFENLHFIGGEIKKSFSDYIREYFKLQMRMLMNRVKRFKEE